MTESVLFAKLPEWVIEVVLFPPLGYTFTL